ncbi:MAG TPA: hypothetical protein VF157_08375 [Chloroflexota bacterium]
MSDLGVRISLAGAEADLEAVVWPGLGRVYCPRAENPEIIKRLDERIGRLERQRGIRPGMVSIQPLVESPQGVAKAYDVASASPRIQAFGPGPKLYLHLDVDPAPEADALSYARSECELVARALDLEVAATDFAGD